jgi:hypothetical protein
VRGHLHPTVRCTPKQIAPCANCIGCWVSPEPLWTLWIGEKYSAGSRTRAFQLVARLYTDWTIPTPTPFYVHCNLGISPIINKYGTVWFMIWACLPVTFITILQTTLLLLMQIYLHCWPPLWSSGQSSRLQIQRSRVRFSEVVENGVHSASWG